MQRLTKRHASKTTGSAGALMQVRQWPAGTGMPGFLIATVAPLRTGNKHSPQLPARQPDGILTPAASPNSSNDVNDPSQAAVRLLRSKRTFHLAAGCLAAAPTRLTVAGPNASKRTCASGTPQLHS